MTVEHEVSGRVWAPAPNAARIARPRAVPNAPGALSEALAVDPARSGAYQWWYFDATSDDGQWALVAIFFVGSVFSPWYARRRSAGKNPRPRDHAAVNVALYRLRPGDGPRGAWAFNETGRRGWDGVGDPWLRVQRSRMERSQAGYELSIDEPCGVLGGSLRGRARFEPTGAPGSRGDAYAIDALGEHRWLPAAPRCAVRVELREPAVSFSGYGYHDVNHGDVPLEQTFSRWTWARAHEEHGTRITYDRVLRTGERRVSTVLASANRGSAPSYAERSVTEPMRLRAGAWALREPRALVVGDDALEEVSRVESSPFYARYTGRTPGGAPAVAEHLDLERFDTRWMQALLPFRARRAGLDR